jgi:hypothetical protein
MSKGPGMTKLDDRALANLEVALDDAFRTFPHGGDHESRKFVARKLLQTAKRGHATLGRLATVAKSALTKISSR